MNPVIDELTWRGLIANSTDLEALSAALDEGPIRFYVGFDPTAPSIHFGNLVQLMVARALQRHGHQPVLLVGGSTGLIGDPKESGERVMNDRDTVATWVERIRAQVSHFVDFEGDNAAILVNNLDWFGQLSALDFLRDIGKHFPVNRMLARDVVARRLESGISYTEFSYVLLQASDYLELHRRLGVVLQTGGSDQWGNITAGVELVRRADGDRVHALATPLLTKADGTKFGKSESGTVWLDGSMTSPYAFHQYFLNVEDAKVGEYLKVFSERPREEIERIIAEQEAVPHTRVAHRALADDVTDLVHSVREREQATQAAQALFGRAELTELDGPTLTQALEAAGLTQVTRGAELPLVVDALVSTGVVESKGAARRAIAEGGAYVNNQKVTDADARLSEDDLLADGLVVVRRGRKKVAGLRLG